jgi:tetratricopeptide (TPR) repeat protein
MPFAIDSEAHIKQWEKYYIQGFVATKNKDYKLAEEIYLNSLREAEAISANDSRVGTSCSELAKLYQVQGKFDKAIIYWQQALTIAKASEKNNKIEIVQILSSLAYSYIQESNFVNAEKYLLEAMDRVKKIPGISQAIRQNLLEQYAVVLAKTERVDKANEINRQIAIRPFAIDGWKINDPQTKQITWQYYKNKAIEERENKNYSESEKLFYLALKEAKKLPQPEEPLADIWRGLAQVYTLKGNIAKAEYCQRQQLGYLNKCLPRNQFAYGHFYIEYGSTLEQQRKFHEATKYYYQALAIWQKDPEFKFNQILDAFSRIARIAKEQKDWQSLQLITTRIIDLSKNVSRERPLQSAVLLDSAADNYLDMGKLTEAEKLANKSLSVKEKVVLVDEKIIADSWKLLAKIKTAEKDYLKAKYCYQKTLAIWSKYKSSDNLQVCETMEDKAKICYKLKQYDEAKSLCLKVIELNKNNTDLEKTADKCRELLKKIEKIIN